MCGEGILAYVAHSSAPGRILALLESRIDNMRIAAAI